jgi:hypothetical protein
MINNKTSFEPRKLGNNETVNEIIPILNMLLNPNLYLELTGNIYVEVNIELKNCIDLSLHLSH